MELTALRSFVAVAEAASVSPDRDKMQAFRVQGTIFVSPCGAWLSEMFPAARNGKSARR